MTLPRLLPIVFILTLTGCASMFAAPSSATPPENLYSRTLIDPATGEVISLAQAADALADADVVVVGEYHSHPASHLLQADLQSALYRQNPDQILTMEQFELDHQADLNAYLAGDTGETEMIEDTGAWDNYRGSYRPLVEFARQHELPVIAANAPGDIVRCVGRQGADYLATLPPEQRATLPEYPFQDTPAYREKFVAAIAGSHGSESAELSGRMLNIYHAQLLRDTTMAARIAEAHRQHPRHQILHTTGTFHSEERLGTVAALQALAPELTIRVISPVFWPEGETTLALESHRKAGDLLYAVLPLPPAYRNPDRERKAMAERFKRPPDDACA
ncbi:MAG: ChaN family lipoprotein [Pseudomonadota bacterium]|nr:ChaN family lipoprotein [Pseudomonadota bacterium]